MSDHDKPRIIKAICANCKYSSWVTCQAGYPCSSAWNNGECKLFSPNAHSELLSEILKLEKMVAELCEEMRAGK